MKILSAEQIHELDKFTIQQQSITSVELMERAATKFFEEFTAITQPNETVCLFCGTGNNGGDGLVVARLLIEAGYKSVKTYVVKQGAKASSDFLINEERLKKLDSIQYIETENQIPAIDKQAVVVDAIFGSGLTRPVEGIAAAIINAINLSGTIVYSVDLPSGLYCDKANGPNDAVIISTCTYTFHAPKLSFLFADNGKYVPDFKILDIGLSPEYESELQVSYEYIDDALIESIFKKRAKFSHKGTYGHALICAGSYGKIGAVVLSVSAALRSGAGLVTAHVPKCGYNIMQTVNPEAMVLVDEAENELTGLEDATKFSAIGIGPGIGMLEPTADFVEKLLRSGHKNMVIDADALNIISEQHYMRDLIPQGAVLTPHPGEFKRLMGNWENDTVKIEKQIIFSKQHQVVIVLKGANTSISTPDGKVYFNSTGNPGMAKGGSGDVLTGVITSLLAQGYTSEQAAVIGVFIHGRAGDIAVSALGQTGITARDIIQFLPEAFAAFE